MTDVLVVGGGPAGSATSLLLAQRGHRVVLVEKRPTPRHKSCGDTLTPRAMVELEALGVDVEALGAHRTRGVRFRLGDRDVEVPWPRHPELPGHGAVLRRDVLDQHLRDRAAGAGVTVLMGHEATTPLVERGFIRGAEITTESGSTVAIPARYVVVADGANSRFGRSLGTTRQRNWPYGVAARTYFRSNLSSQAWVETSFGLTDLNGSSIAGYGWVAPLGNGTINVGTGVLSSSRDVKSVNALKLLDRFIASSASRWHFDPSEPLKAPTRLRIPLGGSIRPTMGPTFLVVGDAAGLANPFNGDGIHAAVMSGRLAAEVVHEALGPAGSTALQRYPKALGAEVGEFHQVGRLAARFIGRPSVLRSLLLVGRHSDAALGAALRIATDERRAGQTGGAERAYAVAQLLTKFAPSW